MIETSAASLQGRRILVVEDEYMIAQEVTEALFDAGAETVGPVPSIAAALRLVANEQRIDGAVLDVNLGHEMIWPVVDILLARGVPLVLATGYDAGAIPPTYALLSRCEKPVSSRTLLSALARALDTGA